MSLIQKEIAQHEATIAWLRTVPGTERAIAVYQRAIARLKNYMRKQ